MFKHAHVISNIFFAMALTIGLLVCVVSVKYDLLYKSLYDYIVCWLFTRFGLYMLLYINFKLSFFTPTTAYFILKMMLCLFATLVFVALFQINFVFLFAMLMLIGTSFKYIHKHKLYEYDDK